MKSNALYAIILTYSEWTQFSARKIGINVTFINYVLQRFVQCRGVKELCYSLHTYYYFVNNAISNLYGLELCAMFTYICIRYL